MPKKPDGAAASELRGAVSTWSFAGCKDCKERGSRAPPCDGRSALSPALIVSRLSLCKTRYGLFYLIGGRINQFIQADPSLSSSLENTLGEKHLDRWTCKPRRHSCHHHFKGITHGSDEFRIK